jgi:hypothetical protein
MILVRGGAGSNERVPFDLERNSRTLDDSTIRGSPHGVEVCIDTAGTCVAFVEMNAQLVVNRGAARIDIQNELFALIAQILLEDRSDTELVRSAG